MPSLARSSRCSRDTEVIAHRLFRISGLFRITGCFGFRVWKKNKKNEKNHTKHKNTTTNEHTKEKRAGGPHLALPGQEFELLARHEMVVRPVHLPLPR